MEVEVLNDCYTAKDEAGPILSIYIREVTLPEGGYDERTVCEITSIQQYGRTQTEANQAVKLLFDHLFEEFDDFPYIPDDLDDEEKAPIAFLLENGYLSKKHLLDGEDEFAEPDLSRKATRKNLIESSTTKRDRDDAVQSGYFPLRSMIRTRAPRPFKQQRASQILRHIATQLFHYCCMQNINPTEVQVMYLEGCLYISANLAPAVALMIANIQDITALKTVLTTTHANGDDFDTKTSVRHAAKLNNRIYGDYAVSDRRASKLKGLLASPDSNIFPIVFAGKAPDRNSKKDTYYSGSGIYFVKNTVMPDRHAEENLMDILEHRLTKLEFLTETPIIVGKKRPCFTCHARLTSLVAEESGIELEFNPNKGLLYKMAAYKQDKKSAKATAESLVYSSEVFVSTAGGSGYATMSDSEEDEPKLGAVAKLSVT